MSYGKVLGRAWHITLRWRFLWLLGFLVSLSSSLSGTGSTVRFSSRDTSAWMSDLSWWPLEPALVGVFACAGLLLAILLAVVSTISTGGLIAGVQQIEDEGTAGLRSAWRVGVRRFWRLIGISLLTTMPAVLAAVAAGVLLALGLVPVAASGDQTAGGLTFTIVSIVCGSSLLCAVLPIGIAVALINAYAQRAAILEDLPWLEAIRRGWQVLRATLGPTLILGLITVAISLVAGLLLGVVAAPIILALVALFDTASAPAWSIGLAVAAAALAFVAYAFVNGILGTFLSAAWTLAYREIALGQPVASEPPTEAPEPPTEAAAQP